MRVKVAHAATIFTALALCSAATGLAQSPANKNAQPTEVAGWRVSMKQHNIPDNARVLDCRCPDTRGQPAR